MTYVVTTEPAVEPLALSELKDVLRITTSDFDTELTRLLTASRRQVEHDSLRRLVTQTVKLYLDRFPVEKEIEIRQAPVQSVTSVTYVDTAGDTQTLSASNYHVDTIREPARVALKTNTNWPKTESNTPNAVVVEFVGGYGDAGADVPAEARLAVQQWAMNEWSDCADTSTGDAYRRLIAALRWTEYHKI